MSRVTTHGLTSPPPVGDSPQGSGPALGHQGERNCTGMCEEAEAGKGPVEIRGNPPLFVQVFILKEIKSNVSELRIVKDLEAQISELRIPKELWAG